MTTEQTTQIEIILALPGDCHRVWVRVAANASIIDAVAQSGLDLRCEALTGYPPAAYGVYGRKIDAGASVNSVGRIELLRGLQVDPKNARRARAAKRRGNA